MDRRILLTGGAGYIGSHTYVALAAADYEVVILDDFSNAKPDVIDRLEMITGTRPVLVEGDVRERATLDALFAAHPISAVIHFAAKKAVGESVEAPLMYFDYNLGGLITLLQAMERAGVTRLVYSSSATVYGEGTPEPLPEEAETAFTNPYAFTKLTGEEMLRFIARDPKWAFGILRYFNPAGAHESGLIGEDPSDIPNNLMPYIAKVATGELSHLRVFGDDYPTPDGTGVRDYIHVSDLAEGHVLSLAALERSGQGHLVNLGTGQGTSVMEMLAAYSRACGRELPHKVVARRPGDVPVYCADPSRARAELGFAASRDLDDMCATSWRWMQRNA